MLKSNYQSSTEFLRLVLINLSCFLLIFYLATANQYSALMGSNTLFYKHLIKTSLGFVLLLLTYFVDEDSLDLLIPIFYLILIITLVTVLLKGTTIKGATRWISFHRFSFQPSEIAKVIVPLMSAHVLFYTKNSSIWLCILSVVCVTIIPSYLIIKQPDLGSGLLVLFSGLVPLVLLNISKRYIFYAALAVMMISPLCWNLLHPYQQQRIQTLFSPQSDLQGSGYHINQSKIAIGSGEVLGKGWANNTQAYLGYLPESDTDFAFALFAEERGFIKTALSILLLYTFYMTLIRMSFYPRKEKLKLICFALAAPQFLYCFVNIGMISGILPVVGVPLPFFSRGGSSFLIQMLTLGLIYKFTLSRSQ